MVKSIGEKDKIAITYHDMLIGLDLEKIIAGKPQLLILDRFALYDHEAEKLEVLKLSKCVTLADYKTERKFGDFDDTCFVILQKNKLEVSLWSIYLEISWTMTYQSFFDNSLRFHNSFAAFQVGTISTFIGLILNGHNVQKDGR